MTDEAIRACAAQQSQLLAEVRADERRKVVAAIVEALRAVVESYDANAATNKDDYMTEWQKDALVDARALLVKFSDGPCPTCGGTRKKRIARKYQPDEIVPCPDCTDGRAR